MQVRLRIFIIKGTSYTRRINLPPPLPPPPPHTPSGIAQIFGTLETPTHVYIVEELCTGGELFEQLAMHGPYSESDARDALRTVFKAVAYMHSCGIVHRDLKPENLLLTSPLLSHGDAHVLVKVVDFGLSAQWKCSDPLLKHACGTWAYGAPEVRSAGSAGYGSSADAWALGVIVYIVLAGFHPFDPTSTASQSTIMQAITKGRFDFDDPAWLLVSDDAKRFVTSLLQTNPLLRLTAADALEHPWMISSPTPGNTAPISAHIAEDILRYRKIMRGKLKASFVVAIASVRMSLQIAKLPKNIKSNTELEAHGKINEEGSNGGASSSGSDVVACSDAVACQ